ALAWLMVTVYGSKRKAWSLPYFSTAYICMMIDGIDDLTEVTPILSVSFRSSIDLRCAARVLRLIGMELMAATPFTLPRVRSHRMRKEGGPAETKCAEPESRASIITDGPPMLAQFTVTFSPAFAACFSTRECFCIMCSGRKPNPPAPSGMCSSLTSAWAASGRAAAAAINAWTAVLFIVLMFVSSGGVYDFLRARLRRG